ncbi:MAG: hypothetical protein FJ086_20270 [Deltaproteobacteria bacterium]|nr:hypothetical protein [Deltaproteobacteria bacterium]
MPTDTYTKAVFTVVAACLVIAVARGTPLVGTAHAQGDKLLALDIVRMGGHSPGNGNTLPVSLKEVGGTSLHGRTLGVRSP